jgi:hypothetical protein
MQEVAGGWRLLRMGKFITCMFHRILLRMRWTSYIARMGDKRNVHKIFIEKPEEKNHSEDLGVDGRII